MVQGLLQGACSCYCITSEGCSIYMIGSLLVTQTLLGKFNIYRVTDRSQMCLGTHCKGNRCNSYHRGLLITEASRMEWTQCNDDDDDDDVFSICTVYLENVLY